MQKIKSREINREIPNLLENEGDLGFFFVVIYWILGGQGQLSLANKESKFVFLWKSSSLILIERWEYTINKWQICKNIMLPIGSRLISSIVIQYI